MLQSINPLIDSVRLILPDSIRMINSAPPVQQGWAAWIIPYIPAAAITIVGVASIYGTFRKGMIDARYQYFGEAIRFRVRQINDFYGPLLLLLRQSEIVYKKLIQRIESIPGMRINLNDFRMLDYMPALLKNRNTKPLVDSIMKTGDEMTKLIREKAGLLEGGLTKTVFEYVSHYEILKAATQNKEISAPGLEQFGYYPRMINREVNEGYKYVLLQLSTLLESADKEVARLLGKHIGSIKYDTSKLLSNLQYYETNSKEYAATFDKINMEPLINNFIDAINTQSNPPSSSPQEILDAGCGTGRDTVSLVRKGYKVTAIDISPAMVRECRKKLRELSKSEDGETTKALAAESICVEMALEEVEYANRFDGVWCAAALLHVPKRNHALAINRLCKATKNGGIIYISTIYGKREYQSGSRFFSSSTGREFRNLVAEIPEIRILRTWLTDDQRLKLRGFRAFWYSSLGFVPHKKKIWINVLLQRKHFEG